MFKREDVFRVIDSKMLEPFASADPATPIREAIADSFAYVEMALELEDRFGLRLQDSDLAELTTLGELAAAIDRSLQRTNAPEDSA